MDTSTAVAIGITAACAGLLPLRGGLLAAASVWAALTGFVHNAYGELTFSSADLLRLGALLAVPVAVAAVRLGLRWSKALRRELDEDDPYGFTAEVHASWDRVRRGVR